MKTAVQQIRPSSSRAVNRSDICVVMPSAATMLLNRGLLLMSSRWKSAAIIGSALLTSLLIPRAGSADAPSARERGVWQKHEYSFVFMGFTSTYSCDGLADKIQLLLTAAGARNDSKSQAGACANGFGRPDKFARADLTFYALAPSGTDTPPGTKQVDGVWRPVS